MIGAPRFYAERLGPGFVDHAELIAARLPGPLAALAGRFVAARGLALGLLARRGERIAVIRRERGSLAALLVCGLPPARPRLFVLELLRRPTPGRATLRLAYAVWVALVERPALRRGMRAGQVMTEWERREYAAALGLAPERLALVPWAWREGGDREPAAVEPGSRAVLSSGRAACDWKTLFAAAAGRDWDLTAICSRADADRVRALAEASGATVEVEVEWDRHDRALRAAAVDVIALADRGPSAGQVRLMAAVEAGVPAVISAVRALDGYAVAGETAELVPPRDPRALGDRVDALLADPARRLRLRDAARARADAWTYREYFDRLRELIGAEVGAAGRAQPRLGLAVWPPRGDSRESG